MADPKVTEEQGAPPTVTVQPLTNRVPVMVRVSPPARSFVWMTGVTVVTVGGVAELYVTTTLAARLTPPSRLVTTTAYVPPAVWAGATQVIEVADPKVTEVQGAPPIMTVQPVTNKVPVMVSMSPPARNLVWVMGLTLVTVGGVARLYVITTFLVMLMPPSGLVTTTK